MRRMASLLLAGVIGAVVGAGVTYSLTRETAHPPAAEEPPPSRPPADMVDSERGLELCRSAGSRQIPGDRPRLLAAFDTTAGYYADWTLDGRPYEPLAVNNFVAEKVGLGRETPLTVCYFDSKEDFAVRVKPPHRVRVLVDGHGGSFTDSIGPRDSFDVKRPGDGPYLSEPG